MVPGLVLEKVTLIFFHKFTRIFWHFCKLFNFFFRMMLLFLFLCRPCRPHREWSTGIFRLFLFPLRLLFDSYVTSSVFWISGYLKAISAKLSASVLRTVKTALRLMKGVFSTILEVHITTTTTVLVAQNFLHTTSDTVQTFHNGTAADEKRFLLSFDETHHMQQYVSI